MKYKIGDKVRRRMDLKTEKAYGGKWFHIDMEMAPEICEIILVGDDHYFLKDIPYCWTDEMFVGLAEEKPSLWDFIRSDYSYLARDKCNNFYCAFLDKPKSNMEYCYWDDGASKRVELYFLDHSKFKEFDLDCDWKDSLICRPGKLKMVGNDLKNVITFLGDRNPKVAKYLTDKDESGVKDSIDTEAAEILMLLWREINELGKTILSLNEKHLREWSVKKEEEINNESNM